MISLGKALRRGITRKGVQLKKPVSATGEMTERNDKTKHSWAKGPPLAPARPHVLSERQHGSRDFKETNNFV